MNPDSFRPAAPSGHTTRFVRITPSTARSRAGELAELKGRYACDVTESDLAHARSGLKPHPDTKS